MPQSRQLRSDQAIQPTLNNCPGPSVQRRMIGDEKNNQVFWGSETEIETSRRVPIQESAVPVTGQSRSTSMVGSGYSPHRPKFQCRDQWPEGRLHSTCLVNAKSQRPLLHTRLPSVVHRLMVTSGRNASAVPSCYPGRIELKWRDVARNEGRAGNKSIKRRGRLPIIPKETALDLLATCLYGGFAIRATNCFS
jgi:hypothetical protein